MLENLQLIWAAWNFINSPEGQEIVKAWALVATALFGASEALAKISWIKANGVFQAAYNGLKWLAERAKPKA